MTTFPGHPALGRGIVTLPGRELPAEVADWPVVTVNDGAIAAPRAAVDTLHGHWLARRPVVVVLAGDADELRAPERSEDAPYDLGVDFEFTRERLQYLVWSNNYDWRTDQPIWWHARRALRQGASEVGALRRGASEVGAADVLLPDGSAAWCDGGPRQLLDLRDGTVILHRDELEGGGLHPDAVTPSTADLAEDQARAVAHSGGPARIIAPAGSGKTRVLTERLRHLLADRQVTPPTVLAVAFNRRAADEMRERTVGLDPHIRTINSLALAIVQGSGPFRRPGGGDQRRVISEHEVRSILEGLVKVRRRSNTDPWIAYLDALSTIRLGLTEPSEAEDLIPDADGIAEVFDEYRSILAERSLIDFDEQIYAAIELLLRDPDARRQAQTRCRHLLVDEFQDLAPAHLLLIRLLAAPTYDVFGVGDDDQVIYSYAGATPEFLINYERYFPGAAQHALEVNYRCPPLVVDGAVKLLSWNTRRVAKTIRAASATSPAAAEPDQSSQSSLMVASPATRRQPLTVARLVLPEHTSAALKIIEDRAADGVVWNDIAVLTRVNSALLPIQVTLMQAGVPCDMPLGPEILERTGVRAALAYLRIGADPDHISGRDVADTVRRPSRRIAPNVIQMMTKRSQTSVADLRRLANALTGADSARVDEYADDLEAVAEACRTGTTRQVLSVIRKTVGLGGAMDILDSSRREADRSTHLDDLAALELVADLHGDPQSFEGWLRGMLAPGGRDRRGGASGGRGGSGGTARGRGGLNETADAEPFSAGDSSGSADGSEADAEPRVTLSTVHRVKGQEWPHVIVLGANGGAFPHRLASDEEEERRIFHVAVTRCSEDVTVIADIDDPSPFCAELLSSYDGTPPAESGRLTDRRGANRKAGTPGGGSTRPGAAARPDPANDSPAMQALRAWRTETARRDKVPAYVVFSDAHLSGIAASEPTSLAALARCPGIGPVKLERYGDEILAVLEAVHAGGT